MGGRIPPSPRLRRAGGIRASARRLRHTRRLFEAGGRIPVASRSRVLASQRRRKSVASVRQHRRVRPIVRLAGILAPVAGRDCRSSSAVEAPRKSGPANRRRVRGAVEIGRGYRAVTRLERVIGIEPTQPAWKAGALPLSYTRTVQVTAYLARARGQGGRSRTPCMERRIVRRHRPWPGRMRRTKPFPADATARSATEMAQRVWFVGRS